MTYSQFEQEWLGKKVDVDHYPKEAPYQCADLVKQYLIECFGIPNGAYGNAIYYWTNTNPAVLAAFDRVEGADARQGDIVILKATAVLTVGHIALGTGVTGGGQTEILEQNGATGNGLGEGGDAIRKRSINQNRVAGLLRPKGEHVDAVKEAMGNFMRRTWFWLNGQQEPDMSSINRERDQVVDGSLDAHDLVGRWLADAIAAGYLAKGEDYRSLVAVQEAAAQQIAASTSALEAERANSGSLSLQLNDAKGQLDQVNSQSAQLMLENGNLSKKVDSQMADIATLRDQLQRAQAAAPTTMSPGQMVIVGILRLFGLAKENK